MRGWCRAGEGASLGEKHPGCTERSLGVTQGRGQAALSQVLAQWQGLLALGPSPASLLEESGGADATWGRRTWA